MKEKYLRRYTDLPALIYLLREKKITLLDPRSWDDSNDSYYLSLYKDQKELKTILALCFTQKNETYHHWRIFAPGSSGVCITFKRAELIQIFKRYSSIRTGDVEYFNIRDLRDKLQNNELTADQLPFIKRYVFEDEGEFRVIFASIKSDLTTKDIPIPLSCIPKISLSPWANRNLLKHVKGVLMTIDGCEDIEIFRSTLIGNEEWKKIGEFAS